MNYKVIIVINYIQLRYLRIIISRGCADEIRTEGQRQPLQDTDGSRLLERTLLHPCDIE